MILQSQASAKGQSQDLKAACLHPIFQVALATFVEAKRKGAALDNICLTLCKQTEGVILKLFFVLLLMTCKVATTFLTSPLVTVTQ
jgi:hypothetical protein